MRISRLLAGSLPFFTFMANAIPGTPPIANPLSDRQKMMDRERRRIAELPSDRSLPSRQTKRALARAVAKARRSDLMRKAVGKQSYVDSDWRAHLPA